MFYEFRGSWDADLRAYAERRLSSWIGPLERDLPTVTVCLATVSAEGVARTRCRMVTRALPWSDVAVEETDVDRFAAIDRCAERLSGYLELAGLAGRKERGAA